MKTTSTSVQRLTKLALLLAIELAMRAIGLDSIMIGPLKMSFLTLPIAVAAMLCGPLESMALGAVFGILSLADAITGRSPMTGTFFALSPVHTVILCVGMRMLMGLCCGYAYKLCRKADAKGTWSCQRAVAEHPVLHGLHRACFLPHGLHPGIGQQTGSRESADVRGASGRRSGTY